MTPSPARPRSTRRHLLALTAICAVASFVGLTTHGLTNWQEAQRAVVARDMHDRGDWIVPTVDGRPYLAKPPAMYWAQLSLAAIFGHRPGELELRLTVALAGWAGVLATYAAGRALLRRPGAGPADPSAARTAFWGAAMLATGLLYVRSSRIGELDILLAPFVAGAVGAVGAAWGTADRARRWALIALATVAATLAMMTKGPPGLLVIGLASYGGMALWAAWRRESNPDAPAGNDRVPGPCRAVAAVALVGCAAALIAVQRPRTINDWLGVALFSAAAAAAAATLARLCEPRRAGRLLRSLAATHPVLVLGVPCAALWAWGRAVAARIGDAEVARAALQQTEENLLFFVLESPIANLEAASYGVGLGSIAALITAVHAIRRRPEAPRGLAVIAAWTVLSLIAFSALGKGVPRYLTPAWPGIALLGGVGVAMWLGRAGSPRRPLLLGVAVALLAAGQGLWYGVLRETMFASRSPRALIAELVGNAGVDPRRLAQFEVQQPALDFYADGPVPSVVDTVPRPGMNGAGPATLDDLRAWVLRDGPWTLLVRARQTPGLDPTPAIDRLLLAGFVVRTIPAEARFETDNGRAELIAVEVSLPGG